MKNKSFLLAFILFLITVGLITYRVVWLRYPLVPNPQAKAWHLNMSVLVKPEKPEVPMKIQIGIPRNRVSQTVIDERVSSGPLDAALYTESGNHTVMWSGSIEAAEDTLSYESTIVIRQKPALPDRLPDLLPIPAQIAGEDQRILLRIANGWMPMKPSARVQAAADTIRDIWNIKPPSPEDRTAWIAFVGKYGKTTALLALLTAVGLPARDVEGLMLTEGSVSKTVRWVGVWVGHAWQQIDPVNGRLYTSSEAVLPLVTGGLPLIRAEQGQVREIRWSLARQIVSPWRMHMEPAIHGDHFLNRWSLFTLPPEFQTIFRIILLVPIGALMICILRNVVGFPTFGIFMPVLMALAFRTTGLLYGLLIFAGVVFIGYAIRRWINALRLLLVPRLATILTLVVFCFAVLAVIGNKFDMRNMMAVGLLPFVILTMTVERFYVLVEESGIREALLTSAGSAAVAVLTYGILGIERLQLFFFVYPETLFAIAACQILLGRYTGYRLSEYIRFRALRKSA